MQELIVIEGPTASGKTALAVAMAKALNTVVLSADSRQFYREIAIGTAKPTPDEMQQVPHYFIDSHSIHTPVTASAFAEEALELLQNELSHLPQIVVAGGSGMFIDALCIGLDPIPTDDATQQQLREEWKTSGLEPLLEELKESDPVFFAEVDQDNPPRILRALEVLRFTGKPFSEWRNNAPPARPFAVQRFVIEHPREQLYNRINHRVDLMMENGLLEEVRSVLPYRSLTSLQTVGYKELFDYFDGTYSLEEAVEKIKQHTRNYAKRQLTWFKRHPESVWIPFADQEIMLQNMLQFIHKQ